LKNRDFPLEKALRENEKKARFRFHIPASSLFNRRTKLKDYCYELTELPGLDDLSQPSGIIEKAQELAAFHFSAGRTFFLVNGSTAGIVASIWATCQEGDKILLPRNIHRSVVAGLVLSGAEPLFIPVEYLKDWGIPLNVLPQRLHLRQNYGAALITSPSYGGITTNLQQISAILAERSSFFLVDEAHGGHLVFHEAFPRGASASDADIWVNSAHKTLGALTPGAFLHQSGERVDPKRLQFILNLLQTSSPSYPVMASLDKVRSLKKEEWNRLVQLAGYAREKINRETGFYCLEEKDLPEEFGMDPLRLTILVDQVSLNGHQVGNILRETYGLELELTDVNYLLAIIQPGATIRSVKVLLKALKKIFKNYYCRGKTRELNHKFSIPPLEIIPRAAATSAWKEVLLDQAVGEISAKTVAPVPPGIPLLIPGEKITREIVEAIKKYLKQKVKVSGLKNNKTLDVVDRQGSA